MPDMKEQIKEQVHYLRENDPEKLERIFSQLSEKEAQDILYDPDMWLRPQQQIKDEWPEPIVLVLAGRGMGKTFMAIQWLRKQLYKGVKGQIMAISRTASDLRDTIVYNGFLEWNHPDWDDFQYEPSKSRIVNKDGKAIRLISAEHGEEAVRGGNSELIWIDELGSIPNKEVLDQALLTLRVGQSRCLITTTPRPTEAIIDLYYRAVFNDEPSQEGKDVRIITGKTSDNYQNLSSAFKSTIVKAYEGTSLERQELYGELLLESEGALWSRKLLKEQTLPDNKPLPSMDRVAIGIDPAVTTNKNSDKTGIVVSGLGSDSYGYVLSDHTARYSSDGWVQKVLSLYDYYSEQCPTSIVVESNQGGNLLAQALQRNRPFLPIDETFSSRSKIARAQPISMLYEQGKIFHVRGLTDLENELCSYDGSPRQKSPNRMDAMIFALNAVLPVKKSFTQVTALEL